MNQEQERAALEHCLELARQYEAYSKATDPVEKAELLVEVLAAVRLIRVICQGYTPSAVSVLTESSVAAVVRGQLKSTILYHGPITNDFLASATKRITKDLLGHLRQASTADLLSASAMAEVERLKKELRDRDEKLRDKQIEIRKLVERLGIPYGEKKEDP
jgi:hypothetical protein